VGSRLFAGMQMPILMEFAVLASVSRLNFFTFGGKFGTILQVAIILRDCVEIKYR
jgi:hypothetical protein